MSKSGQKISQLNLLDVIDLDQDERRASGELSGIEREIRAALKQDQRGSGLSREQIVDEMVRLGANITYHIYNNCLDNSHNHRFALAWLAPHCLATGGRHVLNLLAELLGGRWQDAGDVVYEELGRIQQLEAELARRKRELAKQARPLLGK